MVTVHEVPPNKLIGDISEKLKDMNNIESPDWAPYVKTGVHKEKAPLEEDWWYKRVSAILRSVYVKGPIGISKLRGKYGGKQERGSKPSRVAKGSGSVVRTALKQLEDEGLIKKENKGRMITPEGQSLLDNSAYEILKKMAEDDPELTKYL
ncbi:MAG: 30S ribosomal protein S19e [Candidatus Saliniplasma sp.]